MKLIDKDALVVEIERLKENTNKRGAIGKVSTIVLCNELLSFVDSLEVKEVDLDKELNKYFITNNLIAADIQFEPVTQMKKCAKYFFELGQSVSNSTKVTTPDIDDVLKENDINPYSKEAKIIKESYYMTIEKLTQKRE